LNIRELTFLVFVILKFFIHGQSM